MGFIIWYKIEFIDSTDTTLVTVSNDVYSGQYIIDADITVKMLAGPYVSPFEIRLINLPRHIVGQLTGAQANGTIREGLQAKIFLGYFEDLPAFSPEEVVIGAITKITTRVTSDGLLEATVKGEELGGYRLRTNNNVKYSKVDNSNLNQVVKSISEKTEVALVGNHGLQKAQKPKDLALRHRNSLKVLQELAQHYEWPVVIRDNKLFINENVGGGEPIETISPDKNIVKSDEQFLMEEYRLVSEDEVQRKPRSSLNVTVLGNPKLRVGQRISVESEGPAPNQLYRIHNVIHSFSPSSGYTCRLLLVIAKPGDQVQLSQGATAVMEGIGKLARSTRRNAIDVGQVKTYHTGDEKQHRATLHYGQSPAMGKMAPSIDTPIDETRQPLPRKPIASPFAWHKCGLVVPVYPKMRALLAHNRGSVNDAVVTGFLWAENPRYEPPKNEPGDYWLCLPTGVKPNDEQPKGKGVNDLTDKDGRRVVQAKGLHILVGSESLPPVGERPKVPDDLDDTIVIEHQSGTKITITGDGAVKIETDNQDISLTNGGVTLSLSGSAVNVS